jgi:hypothetical protein
MPILDNIPFCVDLPRLFQAVHARPGSANACELERMAAEAEAVARPRAMYTIGYIDTAGDDYVEINGLKVTSRVLRVNLADTHRVFAFVATSGAELEDWANQGADDLLRRFWAEEINRMGVATAAQALLAHLSETYGVATLSAMNPGSLADWPLAQQRVLFALLGDTQAAIGVTLKESLLMVPTKSVSGIAFPSEQSFASCQLCPREACPNRRAPYDAGLKERKYAPAAAPAAEH